MMEVGTLVKEKEGPRFGGLVVESKKINDKRIDVKIFRWESFIFCIQTFLLLQSSPKFLRVIVFPNLSHSV